MRCYNCKKRLTDGYGYEACAALTRMIGKKKDCFAWTDDPGWERKVKKAVNEYAIKK